MEFKKIQSYTFIGLLLAITLFFFWIVRFYFYPIFWAAVIAALFYPLYLRILRRVKHKDVASGIVLIIVFLLVVIPLTVVVSLIVNQSLNIYHQFANVRTFTKIGNALHVYAQWPIVKNILGASTLNQKLAEWGGKATAWAYQFLASSGQNTIKIFVQVVIMFYTLFYFLRDGEMILQKIMYLLPLGDRYEKMLYLRFVSTSRATLKGTLLIGLIQGGIGMLIFFLVGVPGWAFWGVIMIALSIIPSFGASFLMFPTALIYFLLGNFWVGGVILVGAIISGTVDNVIRPPLVGRDTQMHPLFIFFSTLGGLLAFGVSGFVIGPVITAFLLSVWGIYAEKYKEELTHEG